MILLNGWVLPIGEAALGRVCTQSAKQACYFENILLPQCLLTFFFRHFLLDKPVPVKVYYDLYALGECYQLLCSFQKNILFIRL